MARKVYGAEFKRSAVTLVTGQDYKPEQAAKGLGLHIATPRLWLRKYRVSGKVIDPVQEGDFRKRDAEPEREASRLRRERDILKKRRPSSRRRRRDLLRLDQNTTRRVPCPSHVPGARRGAGRVLRLAERTRTLASLRARTPSRPTRRIATSVPSIPPTGNGYPASPTSRPARAGCTSRVCPTARGVQHACEAYQSPPAANGVDRGMSRVGSCYDDATKEGFGDTLKRAVLGDQVFETIAEAHATVFESRSGV